MSQPQPPATSTTAGTGGQQIVNELELPDRSREGIMKIGNSNGYGLVLDNNNNHHDEAAAAADERNIQTPTAADKKGTTLSDTSKIPIDDAIELLGNGSFQFRILWAAGLCFAADSMEVLLLSFLTVVLQNQWELTEAETSSITSSMFFGAFFGTLCLGHLGDHIGRKPVFTLTAGIISLFGFLTAFVNGFWSILICRFLVGFGVGGLTVPFDTLAEFVPTSHRGTNLLVIEYFWTAGTLLVPALAYFSLGRDNDGNDDREWRWFVVLCAVPCLFSTLLGMVFVPESPRWLLSQNRHDEALDILRSAALCNGKDPQTLFPDGVQITDLEEEGDSNFLDLLSDRWRCITLKLWGAWSGFAFLYYGTIIAVTLVFSQDDVQGADGQDMYTFDYGAIFASASSEIAGTTFVILLVDRVGRIPSQTVSFVCGGISAFAMCLLAAQDAPVRAHLIITAFLARMFFMSASCATWVSTAEILTTEIRTTGHSAANAIARISGALSPFVVATHTKFPVVGIVVLVVSLCTGFCTWHLPETKGKVMGAIEFHHKVPANDGGVEQTKIFSSSASTPDRPIV